MGYISERSRAPVDVESWRGTRVRSECIPLGGAMLALAAAPLGLCLGQEGLPGTATLGPLLQSRWIQRLQPSQTFWVLSSTLLWEGVRQS